MVSEYSDIKHDFRFSFWVAIVVFVLFVVSGFALTAGRCLEDPAFLNAFIFYSILGGVGLAFNIVVTTYNYVTKSRALRPIVHEPEESMLYRVKLIRNPLMLFLITMIIFSVPLFVLGKFQNTFFSQIPFATQQITTFSSVWADAIFPALAENLFTFIIVALLYTWNYKTFAKKNRVYFQFINFLVIPLIYATAWMLFHLARYGSSDIALSSVFIFALIGLFLTMLTVSAIPYFVMHFLTNFMLALKKYGLMSNDLTVVVLILSEVVMIVAFFAINYFDKSRVKS